MRYASGEKMKRSALGLLVIGIMPLKAALLPLPRKYDYKAVYYVKAYQLDDFCCGYNALFNACNMEAICEMPNKYSNYAQFKSLCMQYLKSQGINPKASVWNSTLDELAQKLGLKKLVNLYIDKETNNIEPLIQTKITYPYFTAKKEVQRLLREAATKHQKDFLQKIKNDVDKSNGRSAMVHFICGFMVKKEPHGILITFLKNNKGGRALFVFDNMNLTIQEHAAIQRYIDFLCALLNVSHRNTFTLPRIPDVWPTTPLKKIGY